MPKVIWLILFLTTTAMAQTHKTWTSASVKALTENRTLQHSSTMKQRVATTVILSVSVAHVVSISTPTSISSSSYPALGKGAGAYLPHPTLVSTSSSSSVPSPVVSVLGHAYTTTNPRPASSSSSTSLALVTDLGNVYTFPNLVPTSFAQLTSGALSTTSTALNTSTVSTTSDEQSTWCEEGLSYSLTSLCQATTTTSTAYSVPTTADSLASVTSAITSPTVSSTSTSSTTVPPITFSSHTPPGCFDLPGGVQPHGAMGIGCGSVTSHIQACYDSLAPWTDPYNNDQSLAFQTCACQTSQKSPFTSNSMLWRNYTGCAECLQTVAGVTLDTLSFQLQKIENFCRSQNPCAYPFVAQLEAWITKVLPAGPTNYPLSGSITNLGHLSAAFTTMPLLANLAYGASAPFDGSLAFVTPSLTTYTVTSPSNTKTVTSLVTWLPMSTSASAYNAASASISAEVAASAELGSALNTISLAAIPYMPSQRCIGKCPNAAAPRSRSLRFAAITCAVLLGIILQL